MWLFHRWAHLSVTAGFTMPLCCGVTLMHAQVRWSLPHLIGLLLPAEPVALLLLVQGVPHHVSCLLPGGGSRVAITDHPNSEVPSS